MAVSIKKIHPIVHIGCAACNKTNELALDISGDIKVTDPPQKVTSLYKKEKKKKSKVTTLF